MTATQLASTGVGAPATGAAPFAPTDIAGCMLWLKADALALNDGDAVSSWTDFSGGGNHFTQATAGNKPTYKTNIVNGKAVIRFDGFTSDLLVGPNLMSGKAAGEIFGVVAIDADPPGAGAQTGIWNFGSHASSTHYPFTDSSIYDNFGTTARKTVGNPTPSLAAWRLYNTASAASDWKARLDGTQIFTTATNTVGWTSAPAIGVGVGSFFLDGDMAEVILYDTVLSAGNRDLVETYIAAKYGLTIA